MRFDAVPVQAVKSISQRNLALHWQSLHARFGLPRFADFSPGDRAHDPRRLLVWTVGERDGQRDYRQLYRGDYAAEAFGAAMHPDEAPEPLRTLIRAGLDECATAASMIFMSISAPDPSGNRIDCERLLLPFGNGGTSVTQILSSLQLVSLEGTFDRPTVVQHFMTHAQATFCGRIEPAPRPVRTPEAGLAATSPTA